MHGNHDTIIKLCFSEILGKSHYLFVVWFLYDELVYLKDSEFQQEYGTEQVRINIDNIFMSHTALQETIHV